MKYRCLIFDHDDTTVNSTAKIHYPCFVAFVKEYGLDIECSLEEYVRYNFDPGVFTFYRDICGMSEEMMETEYRFWSKYASGHRAEAFPGIKEIMEEHRANGGILAVVSHSHAQNIMRDYEYNHLPIPDVIYGIEQPRHELKPAPVPVFKLMEKYSLSPEDILVIDDLKPGYDMARAAGVDFAAASWCFDIPENRRFMEANADYVCNSTEELAKLLK